MNGADDPGVAVAGDEGGVEGEEVGAIVGVAVGAGVGLGVAAVPLVANSRIAAP